MLSYDLIKHRFAESIGSVDLLERFGIPRVYHGGRDVKREAPRHQHKIRTLALTLKTSIVLLP